MMTTANHGSYDDDHSQTTKDRMMMTTANHRTLRMTTPKQPRTMDLMMMTTPKEPRILWWWPLQTTTDLMMMTTANHGSYDADHCKWRILWWWPLPTTTDLMMMTTANHRTLMMTTPKQPRTMDLMMMTTPKQPRTMDLMMMTTPKQPRILWWWPLQATTDHGSYEDNYSQTTTYYDARNIREQLINKLHPAFLGFLYHINITFSLEYAQEFFYGQGLLSMY